MSAQEDALNVKLVAVVDSVAALAETVRLVVERLNSVETVDLSDEAAALDGLVSQLDDARVALEDALGAETPSDEPVS